MHGLRKFILTDSALVAIFFGLFGSWIFGAATSSSEFLIVLLAIFIFSIIQADIIHRLSGVPLNKKRRWGIAKASELNHKYLEIMNQYWFADSIIFLVISLVYLAIFQRSNWHHAILLEALLLALIIARMIDNRTRIKGVRKKELFQ